MSTHFLAYCLTQPWAMELGRLNAYKAILLDGYRAHARGAKAMEWFEDDGPSEPAPLYTTVAAAAPRAGAPAVASGSNIAVVQIRGPITQRAQMMGCGDGASVDAIQQAFRAALADDSVGSILLDVDSPGGTVTGIPELADEIRSSTKPVTAFASGMAASAAYWLASAASDFWMLPSAEVGSIGVYMAHEDISQMLENEGVKVTFIYAGEHKVEGNPTEPLADEARDYLQASVDRIYGQFTAAVGKGRKTSASTVVSTMGKGRTLDSDAALGANMVDNVGTFDDVVASMRRKAARSGGAARARAQANIASVA